MFSRHKELMGMNCFIGCSFYYYFGSSKFNENIDK